MNETPLTCYCYYTPAP